jgi:hypothetical protein
VVFKSGGKINVPVSLGDTASLTLGLDESIAVENIVGASVVKDESLQVLDSVLAKQECIDLGTKLLECKVGRREQCATRMISAVVSVKQTSLAESQLESRKLGGKKVDDFEGSWRRDEKGVNTVNDTVGTKDVDGNDTAIKVEGQTLESNVDTESLCSPGRQVLALHQSRDSVGHEHSSGRIKVGRDVVLDELLDSLLARLMVRVVVRESSVLGCKDREIIFMLGRVELLDKVGVLADELGELFSVLGRAEQLPDRLVGLVIMVRRTVMRRVRVLLMVFQILVCSGGSSLKPRLGIKGSVMEAVDD